VFLCRSLPDTACFDCELPRVRRWLEDPEGANLVVAADVDRSYAREEGGVRVRYVSLEGLVASLARGSGE